MQQSICLIVLALIISITSCTPNLAKETRGNETVIGVSTEDTEMNQIMENARSTIADFIKSLDDVSIDPYLRSVKFPFTTDPGSQNQVEHIWITDITKDGEKYFGIIANEPFYIKTMQMGDRIEFDINNISDWYFIKDGYMTGGKSIKYFYDQMSEEEKTKFVKENGIKFKE